MECCSSALSSHSQFRTRSCEGKCSATLLEKNTLVGLAEAGFKFEKGFGTMASRLLDCGADCGLHELKLISGIEKALTSSNETSFGASLCHTDSHTVRPKTLTLCILRHNPGSTL